MIKKFNSKVLKKVQISDSVYLLYLQVPEDFDFIPGQYASLISEMNQKTIRRPYSICDLKEGSLELCIKVVENGIFTSLVPEMKEGQKIEILGPLGEFKIQNREKDLVFISHGVGIAPFKPIIKSLLEQGFDKKIILIAGYREKQDIIFDLDFQEMEKEFSNFVYIPSLTCPEEDWQGKVGRVQEVVENLDFNENSDFYLCGLNQMIVSTRSILNKKGIPMRNIYSERYD